jgi:hypothetical protein
MNIKSYLSVICIYNKSYITYYLSYLQCIAESFGQNEAAEAAFEASEAAFEASEATFEAALDTRIL